MKIYPTILFMVLIGTTYASPALRGSSATTATSKQQQMLKNSDGSSADLIDVVFDPYLQRRRHLNDRQQQRQLKIPIGIPVFNPGKCRTRYPQVPTLLSPPPPPEEEEEVEEGGEGGNERRIHRHRFLQLADGVIAESVTMTCPHGNCGDGDGDGDGEEDRIDPPPSTGDGSGLPINNPPPTNDTGDTSSNNNNDNDGLITQPLSIETSTSCQPEDSMLGCPYTTSISQIPAEYLTLSGIADTNVVEVQLQCICVPKLPDPVIVDVSRTEQTLPKEFVFECLLFPLEPIGGIVNVGSGAGDGGDRVEDAGDGTATPVAAANEMPYGCVSQGQAVCPTTGAPLNGGDLLGYSNMSCPTDGNMAHNAACMYRCNFGRSIQCRCSGGKGVGGDDPKWHCRNFSFL